MPRSLHVRADRGLICAPARSRRHLRVEIVAPRRPRKASLSLGLVLDRSGSMAGEKLELAREGVRRAIRSLEKEDYLSLLAYNERTQVLIRAGAATETARRVADKRLERLEAGGGTDLCRGFRQACEEVGRGMVDGQMGRCLLLSDGLANSGTTDRDTIVEHAVEARRRGITTSTLGVGGDFDEHLLRRMAEAGGGSFYFAERPEQLADFIAGETGEALKVVAREATLVVAVPAGAEVESLNPFPRRSEPGRTVFDLGSLVFDQVLSLLLAVQFPEGTVGDSAVVRCRLADVDGGLEGSAEQVFRYVGVPENRSQTRDREVEREVAAGYAARARQRAAALGRAGAVEEAREVLRRTAARIRRGATGDPGLIDVAAALEQEAKHLRQMDSLDYKRVEYETFRGLLSRGADGMTIGTLSFTIDRTLQLMMRSERHGSADAPFFVAAVTADARTTALVEAAGRALEAADPHALAYAVPDGGARVLDAGAGAVLTRDDELGLAYALSAAGDVVKIAFVRGALGDGTSSHWHPPEKVAIVSLAGWEEDAAPAEAFVAYQMVLHGTRHGRPAWDPVATMHEDHRGCWGDAGRTRDEIEEKLHAGALCGECRRLYEGAGVNVDQLLRLVAAVRELAEGPGAVRS
jgi:Ca-activated chloride channel family protein